DVARDAAQRILRRFVTVDRWERGRPLYVRAVVRATRRRANEPGAALAEHRQNLTALTERRIHRFVVDDAEPDRITARRSFRLAAAERAPPIRHDVEHRETHGNRQPRRLGADAVDDVPHQAGAVFE